MTDTSRVLDRNRSAAQEIAVHLRACDASFMPRLSARVDFDAYAQKIALRAERFEAWAGGRLAGLVAAYCDDPGRHAAFITSVSVLPDWQGRGLASQLLRACIEHVRQAGFQRVELEVDGLNTAATALYRKYGFALASTAARSNILHLPLQRTPE